MSEYWQDFKIGLKCRGSWVEIIIFVIITLGIFAGSFVFLLPLILKEFLLHPVFLAFYISVILFMELITVALTVASIRLTGRIMRIQQRPGEFIKLCESRR